MEEGLRSKYLYRIELYLIKVIPMLVAFTQVLNTILSYFYIDATFTGYVIMYLLMGFLYISSYVFRFCSYHRMFLHYITINLTLNIIDYYYTIPVSDKGIFIMYLSLAGIFLFIILYLKQKHGISIENCYIDNGGKIERP